MQSVLVDSNILLDLFNNDPIWAAWSEETLEKHASTHKLLINPVIYTEVSIKFVSVLDVEHALRELDLLYTPIPKEALFLAGKAFVSYRQRGGSKASPLPDFFIGAHAAVEGLELITRDTARYRTYFPTVKLISP